MSTTLYPAWKQAIADFKAGGFKEGDVLTFEWLYKSFCIPRPAPGMPYEDAQKSEIAFLGSFKKFEEQLLYGELIALRNIRSVGYQLVPAGEQTRWAFREGMHEVNRGLKKMTARLVHVDEAKLTAAEKKENDDAVARAATLTTMLSKTRRLPRP